MVFEGVFCRLCACESSTPQAAVSRLSGIWGRAERRSKGPDGTRLAFGDRGKTRLGAKCFWLLEATLPLLSRIERKQCSRTLYASLGDQLLKRGRGLLRRQCVPTALA